MRLWIGRGPQSAGADAIAWPARRTAAAGANDRGGSCVPALFSIVLGRLFIVPALFFIVIGTGFQAAEDPISPHSAGFSRGPVTAGGHC